jgi:hypothetical protein
MVEAIVMKQIAIWNLIIMEAEEEVEVEDSDEEGGRGGWRKANLTRKEVMGTLCSAGPGRGEVEGIAQFG